MTPKHRKARGAVLLATVLLCVGIFLVLLRISGGLELGPKYKFEAVVPNVVQLTTGADVREAGVDVGKVTAISNRGASAVIGISLDKKYGPVYRNGTVRLATKTIVGENYIALNPGNPPHPKVPEGGLLPISQAQDSVQLDTILSTFGPARQQRLRTLLAGLGGGLSGNGGQELNQTLDALSSTVNQAGPVAQALASQNTQLATFVTDLGSVFTALGQRGVEIQQLARGGLGAAEAVSAQDASLRQSLRDLPGTLGTVRRVTAHLASVGTNADPVLDQVSDSLTALIPALKALPKAGPATVAALQRLHAVTPVAERLVGALKQTAPSAEAAVPPLASVVDQLQPLISYLVPYTGDATGLLYALDDAGRGKDGTGLLARIDPVISLDAVQNLTQAEKDLLEKLLGAGLSKLLFVKGHNNYPAPGTALAPQSLGPSYPRVMAQTGG